MVKIDDVYQKVLAIINKEQRGYVTPQEFNLFADHAQMDIFEQYFYDTNQFSRAPGNDTEYSDMLNYLEEKTHFFEKERSVNINQSQEFYNFQAVADPYKIGSVSRDNYICERVNANQIKEINKSPLLKPTISRPVYILKDDYKLYVYPSNGNPILVNYIRRPVAVNWSSYVIAGNDTYDLTNSVDFELHPSEETKLVMKILQLAGVTLKDYNLTQVAIQKEVSKIQQEKQ